MVSRDSERVEVLDGYGGLLNLSATGAAFIHPVPFEQGCHVKLSVGDVEFESRVVYCHQRSDGYRIGIRFIIAAAETRQSLFRMVDLFSCGVPLQFQIITAL